MSITLPLSNTYHTGAKTLLNAHNILSLRVADQNIMPHWIGIGIYIRIELSLIVGTSIHNIG